MRVVHGALRHPEIDENGPASERRRLAGIFDRGRTGNYRRAGGAPTIFIGEGKNE